MAHYTSFIKFIKLGHSPIISHGDLFLSELIGGGQKNNTFLGESDILVNNEEPKGRNF